MATEIGALRALLSLDSAQFESGIGRAQAKLAGFAARMNGLSGRMAKVGAAMADVGRGIALGIKGQIDAADELSKAAQKFGVPIEVLSRLKYAADLSDLSLEGLGTGLRKLSKNMADAAAGNKKAIALFDGIGVAVSNADGSLRPTEAVLADIADVLAKMPDGAAKTALAMDIFGKAGAEMIPLLNGGKTALQEMAAEANSLGIVISEKTGKAAENFNDNLTRIKTAVGGLGVQMAAALAPALETVSGWLVEATKAFRDLAPATQALMAKFALVTLVAGPLVVALGMVVGSLSAVAVAIKVVTAAMLLNPFGRAATAAVVAGVAIYTYWEPIKDFFAGLWSGIRVGAQEAWAGVQQAASAVWQSISATWSPVGEWFADKWARVSADFAAMWAGIKGMAADAKAATIAAWDGVTESFSAVLVRVVDAFKVGWEAIKAEVSTWPARFIEFGGQIVDGLKQGIIDKWDGMIAGLQEKWQALADNFAGFFGIKSPSRLFRDYGANISEGLALGIGDAQPQVERAMQNVSDSLSTMGSALADYAASASNIGADIGKSLVESFDNAEKAIGNFVKTGKLDFRDLITSMIADLAQLAARKFILGPIANVLSGALGNVGGIFAAIHHAGGMVGGAGPSRMVPAMAFAGAPRMHGGGWAGLKPDEVPAILQRGERVLSRREVGGAGQGQGGGNVTINIQTRDAESFRQSRTQVASDIARAVSLGRRGM